VTASPQPGKTRFLVVHDYGMGGLWWWIWATSAQQIIDTCAELEVVIDPEAVTRAGTWSLEEVDIDAVSLDPALAALRAKRDSYRHLPGYGALTGRDRVYLSMPDEDGGDTTYLMEIGADGRWLRQITLTDGSAIRTDSTNWPINPPLDLYDPRYVAMEIDGSVFEDAWSRASPDPEDQP
jgi:hypothetical protein